MLVIVGTRTDAHFFRSRIVTHSALQPLQLKVGLCQTLTVYCTWYYVVAQMIHRVDAFLVALLSEIIIVEPLPFSVLQYFNEYVVERTTITLYAATARLPRATINSQSPSNRQLLQVYTNM